MINIYVTLGKGITKEERLRNCDYGPIWSITQGNGFPYTFYHLLYRICMKNRPFLFTNTSFYIVTKKYGVWSSIMLKKLYRVESLFRKASCLLSEWKIDHTVVPFPSEGRGFTIKTDSEVWVSVFICLRMVRPRLEIFV